jgi:hypothetical protein
VVPRAQLDEAVADYCTELLAKMPEIVRATRVQLNFWKDLSWAMTVRMAREWLTIHAGSAEVAEGLASFHEKRPVDYEHLRRSIELAGASRRCPSCGRPSLDAEARYCAHCGTALAAEERAAQEIHDA